MIFGTPLPNADLKKSYLEIMEQRIKNMSMIKANEVK